MGWLFKTKKLASLECLHTDVHSHLIPGIDDGARSMEESLDLISQMYGLGYRKLVITPHVRRGSFENDTREFDRRLQDVKDALKEENIPMELEVGAEHTIDETFFNCMKCGTLKHFGKRHSLLIELPFNFMPMDIKDVVFKLQSAGYNLILAHPERYLYLIDEPEMLSYLHDSGVSFQMNILSLVGFYNKETQKFAQRLIKNNMVDLVGSDLHHQPHLDGIKQALSDKYFVDLAGSGRLKNCRY